MKKLALIMIFGVVSVVLSAEEFTIQTISAQKEASITPAFEKKVQKTALVMSKKKEGTCNIVTVGKYPSVKAAKVDMKKAKAISKDAFVRSAERVTPTVCESKGTEKQVAMKESNATVVTPKKEEITAVNDTSTSVQKEGVAMVVSSKENSVVTITPSTLEKVEPVPCSTQPCEKISTNVYLYDKNLIRKSDLHEAIEFYKHSPYHTFRPVALQGSK
ncbi:hypothetical protein [Sulfuricurvum sp.]|uniref:hypothetical protein n=1 Tax=Sulfuricurvum sp. TaxID=2025608 RepID=UPI002601EF95|nr:hypothetical protein [Sulfuricurvum sp.]MDD2782057.1 hypothetical protein [Sulfuricurvum sp.]